jgi:peptidoglycan/LPS O-acetylase OafA/YrhL
MTDGEGETPLEVAPSGSTATLVAPRTRAGDDTPRADEKPADQGHHLTYNPAIDGIRGLAVGAVLLFHGGFSWARGGYLGVSTFFTLSGFLITSLLLAEHRKTGRIGLTAFWARRLRRLLPAAAATLAVIMVSAFLTDELWERTLGGDVIAAALNVANWRFLFDDRSYAALFAAPSPVLHFWSLAIEEQFYWVFPLLSLVILALGRGSLKVYAAALGGLLAISAGLTLVFSDRTNTVYYSTPTRMGEIVMGGLLAVAVSSRRLPGLGGTDKDRRWVPLIGLLGAVALAASAWAWVNVEQATPSLYKGGLLVYAVVSACLVLSACVPGPVKRALSFEPLRLLGLISYGVYLIHWPVFLIMDEKRVDGWLDPFNLHPRGWKLFGLRVAVTLVLSIVSFRLLEQPIRRGLRPRRWKAPPLALGAAASVVLLAVVVPNVTDPPKDPFADIIKLRLGPDPSVLAPDAKIGVTLGDSTGLVTSLGLSVWGRSNNRLVLVGGGGGVGCGIGHGGDVRYAGQDWGSVDAHPDCRLWETGVTNAITCANDRYGRLDVAVIQSGPWDVADRRLPGQTEATHIGEQEYDAFLRDQLEHAADLMIENGATVVWLTAPYIDTGFAAESDHGRMDRFNDMVRSIAEEKEGMVVVDLAAWIQSQGPTEDQRLRPDHIHFTFEGPAATNVEVADKFLGDEIIRASTLERSPFAPSEPPPVPPDEPVPDSCPPPALG